MSIIGLIEFLGCAVILCGVTCFSCHWIKQHLISLDDDLDWRLWRAMIGVCVLLLSVLMLMLFITLVFPGSIS